MARQGRMTGHTVEAASLFGDRQEVTIRHNDEVYRLRITSKGKLILTK